MKIVHPFLKSMFIPALLSLGACACNKAVVDAPKPVVPAAPVVVAPVVVVPAPVVVAPAPVVVVPAPVVAPVKAPVVVAPVFDDIFFDLGKANIRTDGHKQLQTVYSWLKVDATRKVLLEGHCDNRGTSKSNLDLGVRRANAAKDYLVNLGIEAARLKTVSVGADKPFAAGNTEEALGKNRRVHFIAE